MKAERKYLKHEEMLKIDSLPTTFQTIILELVKHIPESKIPLAHHWLILHGRYICQARKPKCEKCGLAEFCKYFNVE